MDVLNMKIAAIGRTDILYNSIKMLTENGHEVPLIVTCEEAPGYTVGTSDFEQLAEEISASFIKTEHINSNGNVQLIKEADADIAISVNWKNIIGQKIIDCFSHGIINAHSGDLPQYRGNAVTNWAIINGETEIALTLHLMTTGLDAGPIVSQKRMSISDHTYISEIKNFIKKNGPKMFLEAIDSIKSDRLITTPQSTDSSLSLRCYPRSPRNGEIDWNQPATDIDRLVRASSIPFDGAYTHIGLEKLIIWKAHVETPQFPFIGVPGQVAERKQGTGEVSIITGRGFLVLEKVETDQGPMNATEVIKTIRTQLGMDITTEILNIRKILNR